MIKLTDILLEIGEGVEPYPFKCYNHAPYTDDDGSSYYGFKTEVTKDAPEVYEYEVTIDRWPESIEVEFGILNQYGIPGYNMVPSKGLLFRVMSTVAAIVKQELELIQYPVPYLKFDPSSGKGGEGEEIDNRGARQRSKLYQQYIMKSMPGIEPEGTTLYNLTGTEIYKQKSKQQS